MSSSAGENGVARPPLRLSVIVPATNAPETLARCRSAIEVASRATDELVVVDGPADASAAEARNLGARRAQGDVLVFVDSDVEVHPSSLNAIRAAFEGDPSLAAVFGSYDDEPGAPGLVSSFRNLLHHHVHHAAPGPATTFWTGLGAVRRTAFDAVGGFDESIDYMEDIDLGMRLSAATERIVLDPRIQGKHLKPWSIRSMLVTDFARRGIPWVALLLRHRRSTSTLNLGWSHRLSAVASFVAFASTALRRPQAAVAAAAALVALNFGFYRLLWRKQGPLAAALGVPLHALHHLAGAAALPFGILRHLRSRRH